MESKKRERSPNFSPAEIRLLMSFVQKYKLMVENKKTDAVTNKNKVSAWKKIETLFNACQAATSYRTWKTLKLKYDGMRKYAKKKSSLQRQELYKNGGGRPNAPDLSEVEKQVLNICPKVEEPEATLDSDPIAIPRYDIVLLDAAETSSMDLAEQNRSTEAQAQHTTQAQVTNKIPEIECINVPRTRVANVLEDTTSKATVSYKLGTLGAARLELVHLQIETARKEQQFLEEKHKLHMLHLANEEKRKQEMHELLVQKMKRGLDMDA